MAFSSQNIRKISKSIECNASNGCHLLEEMWLMSDSFFENEVTESRILQIPISLRMPFLFYMGHLPSFACKTLSLSVKKSFDYIFSRGIDPDVDDPEKCHEHPEVPSEWPSWSEIKDYVYKVRKEVRKIWKKEFLQRRIGLIAEHEAMHLETLQYMLAQSRRSRPIYDCCRSGSLTENKICLIKDIKWCIVPSGSTSTGIRKEDAHLFAWDNEHDAQEKFIEEFKVSKYAISIEQMAEFVLDDGYRRQEFWDDEDWRWINDEASYNLRHPASWECVFDEKKNHVGWKILNMKSIFWTQVKNYPSYTSLAEAKAFSKWKSDKLKITIGIISEEQWIRAAFQKVDNEEVLLNNGRLLEVSDDSCKCNISWCGVVGMTGQGWEMTSSEFRRFEGFVPMEEYEEYSDDFFDGKHFVLKGGSWCTHPTLLRKSFRNFYQSRYPFVFSKIRLVQI